MKFIRNSILFISILLLCSSCALVLNFNDLPEPKGQYIVGTDLFVWEDSYRDEWFTKDKIDSRKIVVQIWYPASEKSDSLYPYMDYKELRIQAISEQINQPKVLIKPATKVEGNSYFKAPLVDGQFPLILFSHGLGGYKTQNSINIETLVSHGYIVIAPDHTYDASITAFPDGSVAEYKSDLPKDYINYDLIAGIGSKATIRSNSNSFEKLYEFHSAKKDWMFGYLSYDIKNEIEDLSSDNVDHLDADNLLFFVPEYVLLLKNDVLEIQSFATKK